MGRFTDLVAQNPNASDRIRLIATQLDAQEASLPAAPTIAPLTPMPPRQPQATEGTWKDVGVTALKGIVGAGEAAVGLANIPTLGRAGKMLEDVGVDFERTHQILDEEYSPYRKQLKKGLADTKGFLPTIEYGLQNPSTIGHVIGESLPGVMLGGVLGRLGKAKGLVQSGAAAAGLGEGAVIAGSMAENIRQQTETGTLTPFQAGISALGGVAGGALGLAGGRIAARLGIPDVDVAVSGVQQKLKGGYLSRVGKSAAVEGVAEELPQSAMEQTLTNIGLGRPAMEGVAEASAMGMLAGSAMGGGFAALKSTRSDPNAVSTDEVAQSVDEALAPTPTQLPLALPAPSIVTDAGSLGEQLARQRAEQLQQAGQIQQGVQQQPLALPAPSVVTDAGSPAELMARERADQIAQEVQKAQTTTLGGGKSMSFATTPTEGLMRYLGVVERKAADGQATSADLNVMQAIRRELNSRSEEGESFGRRQLSLFDVPEVSQEEVFDRLSQAAAQAPVQGPAQTPIAQTPPGIQLPAKQEKRAQRVEVMREKARQIVGRKTQFTAKLNVESDEELLAHVLTRLEAGKSTNADFALARHYGVLDADGNTVDLPAQLQKAQVNLNRVKQDARTNVLGANERLQTATAEVETLQGQIDLIGRAQARLRGDTNAVQEPSAKRVDVQQPAQDGTEVAEGDTQGDVVAEEGQAEKVGRNRTWKVDDVRAEMERINKGLTTTNKQQSLEDAARSLAILMDAAQEGARLPKLAVAAFKKEHSDSPRAKKILASAEAHLTRMNSPFKTTAEETAAREKITQAAKETTAPMQPDKSSSDVRVMTPEDFMELEADEAAGLIDRIVFRSNDIGIDPDSPTAIADGKGGIAPEALQTIVDDILPKLGKNVPRVVILANPKQIQGVKLHPKTAGILGRTGTVVLFYENISDAEHAEMVMFHEIKGHYGLRGFFGKQLDPLLHQLHRADPNVRRIAEQHRKADPERYARDGVDAIAKSTEEVLADLAGENVTGPAWTKFLAGVQTLLRKMGFNKVADWIERHTHAQALDMLIKAREFVVGGSRTAVQGDKDIPASIAAEPFERFTKTASSLYDKVRKIDPKTESFELRRSILGWLSSIHLKERYRKILPQLDKYVQVHSEKDATFARINQMFTDHVALQHDKLLSKSPKIAENVRELMTFTEFGVDPRKKWSAHTWLHGDDNESALRKRVETANKVYYSQLTKEGRQLYDDLTRTNNMLHYAQMAMGLYYRGNEEISLQDKPAFKTDPMRVFRESAEAHSSPEAAEKYWRGVLNAELAAAKEVIYTNKGDTKARQTMAALARQVGSIDESMKVMDQAPYFHLGRHGDYFVAFGIRKQDGKKVVDPKAKEHIAKVLEDAGYTHAQISPDSQDPRVFIRLENPTQMANLRKLIDQLADEGYVEAESASSGIRAKSETGQFLKPEWLKSLEESILASDAFANLSDEQRQQLVAKVRDLGLDLMPDLALAKVLVHRESRPGYGTDMWRSFAHRMQVGAVALADLASAAPMQNVMTEMKAEVEAANRAKDPARALQAAAVRDEVVQREANARIMPKHGVLDAFRAVNYAFFLGMSPAYFLVNMTQVPVILWPELSKKYGYVKAAKMIAKVTPLAFKIMRQTFEDGRKLGWSRAADAIITSDTLKNAGVDKDTSEFLMRMIARGDIDIGNAARELGRVAESSPESKTQEAVAAGLRYASAMGYYSETLTRLVSALAARELHGKTKDTDQFVSDTINNSMFNYSTWAVARMTGKMGLAGPVTPVMTSFMTYQLQLMEKLYREVRDAFDSTAKTEEERKAARRFLKSHLAAVTTLAGTLGMPLATVFAAAADGLCNTLSDGEPCDMKASWRNFLADMFGKDAAEVIAKGVPRAAGFDLSSRVGEQDILPFSRFLGDKRAFEDAIKDQALGMWGSPVSMATSMFSGMKQMYSGEILPGMEQMVPVALKGPVKAYRMATDGYTDKAGNKLPMSPGAHEILYQTVGFRPAEMAEYSEANITQKSRLGQIKREATLIRKNLAKAYEQQDKADFREWYEKASKFDAAHPDMAVLPGIGRVLQQRAQARAMAGAMGTPIGAKPKDAGAAQLTQYANF